MSSTPPSKPAVDGPPPRRLVDVLRAVPAAELQSLVRRLGIPLDAQKRIDASAQVARSLVSLPEVRDISALPAASGQLLRRIAEARGSLLVPSLPQAVEPLAARGVVFVRMRGESVIELILPTAYLIQLRSWEGEDPHGIRALLAQASFETSSAIASHYLGRPATPPLSIALEPAWEVLSSPLRLKEEIAKLSPVEKRLLEAVEREGGEADTEELLDLEREPMRLRGATGVTPSRRGAGFALERRGLLIPVHPNRHVIPTEVAAVVGAEHQAERAARRASVRTSLLDGDYHPRRARFAEDPAPVVMAMALAMRESAGEVRSGVGTPRSLIMRLGQRFGRDTERITLLGALSRAAGLWEASAVSTSAPPGAWMIHRLPEALFVLWKRGGAWDEARREAEVFRLNAEARDTSPIGVLREMLLDTLRDLGEGRWILWKALAGYVHDDDRTAGVARLLRRWADRAGVPVPSPLDVVKRIAFETLPALGILDLGDPDATESDEEEFGPAIRLTSRGRALVLGRPPTIEPLPSRFLRDDLLLVGTAASVAAVLALAPFVEVGEVSDALHVQLATPTLGRAISSGVEPETIKTRITALAPLPPAIAQLLEHASAIVAQVNFAPSVGFLWIEDESIRELLASRRPTADLFLDPSPAGGLLIAAGVEIDRLVRRCRLVGVEILHHGQVLRARSTTPTHQGTSAPSSSHGERKRSSATMRRSEG